MEQVIATINYFIREKLWCSIRKLCDLVSFILMPSVIQCNSGKIFLLSFYHLDHFDSWISWLTIMFIGNEKGCRPCLSILESFWHFPRGKCHRGHPWAIPNLGTQGGAIFRSSGSDLLSWAVQEHRSRNYRYFDNHSGWEGVDGIRPRPADRGHILMAHTAIQESWYCSAEASR